MDPAANAIPSPASACPWQCAVRQARLDATAYPTARKVTGERIVNRSVRVRTTEYAIPSPVTALADWDGLVNSVNKNVRVEHGEPTVNWSVVATRMRNAIVSMVGASASQGSMESPASLFARRASSVTNVQSDVIVRIRSSAIM